MEQWNNVEEELSAFGESLEKIMKESSDSDELYQEVKEMEQSYSLDSIYYELWIERELIKDIERRKSDAKNEENDRINLAKKYLEAMEQDGKKAAEYLNEYMRKYGELEYPENLRKKYSPKLNDMMKALFDCEYSEIIASEGKAYKIGKAGKAFIKFLLKTSQREEGKKILNKKYHEIDIWYQSVLFSSVEVWTREEELLKDKDFLIKSLYKKFRVDDITVQLMQEIRFLYELINELVMDNADSPNMIKCYKRIVKKIIKCQEDILKMLEDA